MIRADAPGGLQAHLSLPVMRLLERYRTPIARALVLLIVMGGAVLAWRLLAVSGSSEIAILPPSPEMTVYVEGEVVDPGVYTLTDGYRVADAIDIAGGFTPDADRGSVNLAATLRDGAQVHVYRSDDVPQRVDINTAEDWMLEALPGIGEVLARRIIDYRTENGPFLEIEDLAQVDGISPDLIDKLRDKITVR
jgi:competence protein ComEA